MDFNIFKIEYDWYEGEHEETLLGKNTKKSWRDFRVQEIHQNYPAQKNCEKQFSVPRMRSHSGIDKKKFEKDLIDAKKFAISLIGNEIKNKDYLGKGYSIECLPEFYEQIIWFLINKKGYIECYFDENTKYNIDDSSNNQINITKLEEITNRMGLE